MNTADGGDDNGERLFDAETVFSVEARSVALFVRDDGEDEDEDNDRS